MYSYCQVCFLIHWSLKSVLRHVSGSKTYTQNHIQIVWTKIHLRYLNGMDMYLDIFHLDHTSGHKKLSRNKTQHDHPKVELQFHTPLAFLWTLQMYSPLATPESLRHPPCLQPDRGIPNWSRACRHLLVHDAPFSWGPKPHRTWNQVENSSKISIQYWLIKSLNPCCTEIWRKIHSMKVFFSGPQVIWSKYLEALQTCNIVIYNARKQTTYFSKSKFVWSISPLGKPGKPRVVWVWRGVDILLGCKEIRWNTYKS